MLAIRRPKRITVLAAVASVTFRFSFDSPAREAPNAPNNRAAMTSTHTMTQTHRNTQYSWAMLPDCGPAGESAACSEKLAIIAVAPGFSARCGRCAAAWQRRAPALRV